MSETQKSTMGPRRLFILLALAAFAYWYFSKPGNTTETDDVESDEAEIVENDYGNDVNLTTYEDEVLIPDVKEEKPQTTIKEDEGYTPQSQGGGKEHSPQSGGGSSDYQPQSSK